jgi:hypothetical protein
MMVSCEPEIGPNDNTVSIKFNINSGSSALAYNTTYTVNGLDIQYTEVRFYISQPVFSSGPNQIAFNDAYFLADAANSNNTFVVGDLGKRIIDGVAFGYGVDSSRNTQNGSKAIQAFNYTTSHPLSAANKMYWSWNPGYIWMKLEGRMDSNDDGDFNDANEIFSYHTGIDAAYTFISRTYILDMQGQPRTIQIDMDIDQFFTGVNIVANPFAHPLDTTSADYNTMLSVQNNANLVFGNFYE